MKQEGRISAAFLGKNPSPGMIAIARMMDLSLKHGSRHALHTVRFSKGGAELVVYEYAPSSCGVLRFEQSKVAGFREWKQPLRVITQKLRQRGWKPSASEEVCHAAH